MPQVFKDGVEFDAASGVVLLFVSCTYYDVYWRLVQTKQKHHQFIGLFWSRFESFVLCRWSFEDNIISIATKSLDSFAYGGSHFRVGLAVMPCILSPACIGLRRYLFPLCCVLVCSLSVISVLRVTIALLTMNKWRYLYPKLHWRWTALVYTSGAPGRRFVISVTGFV